MTVKELEDILRNYDKDLVISFGKVDDISGDCSSYCEIEIDKNDWENTLDITVL